MKQRRNNGAFAVIRSAAAAQPLLTAGTLLCTAAGAGASLVPPLLLGRVVDRLAGGLPLTALAALLYFGALALEGILSGAQESLLVLSGQKMTHAPSRTRSAARFSCKARLSFSSSSALRAL